MIPAIFMVMEILLYANPIVNAYSGADFFGKLIFIALFFLSIATWVIFIQKIVIQKRTRQLGQKFMAKYTYLDGTLQPGAHPFGALYSTLQQTAGALLEKQQGLSASDVTFIRAHLQQRVSFEVNRLERRLPFLSTVISLAPFLGLLGTVWGILLTFSELQTGAMVSASSTMMGGLAMALGTTVLGLLVAIPSLIAFNMLRAELRLISQEMDDYADLLLASVQRHYCR
ncbi:MAG: Tol-Pal system protein TolQ [Chlamydiales bacterium]|nr:Tol-Pal system protein TolQ [Chlamydiales bacterium]MCH9635669.1 Tol-Pal system protein TolQ [Chlamydiales bacterium]MCH9703560.1 MotA/TolQ/ExbB proton channel family protein [Chlamydiota bacterium]